MSRRDEQSVTNTKDHITVVEVRIELNKEFIRKYRTTAFAVQKRHRSVQNWFEHDAQQNNDCERGDQEHDVPSLRKPPQATHDDCHHTKGRKQQGTGQCHTNQKRVLLDLATRVAVFAETGPVGRISRQL